MNDWKTIWDHEIASVGRRVICFAGRDVRYVVKIDETDQDNILVGYEVGDVSLRWSVHVREELNGVLRLSGMTSGWFDQLDSSWYQLTLSSQAVLRFYGDRVLLREDVEI